MKSLTKTVIALAAGLVLSSGCAQRDMGGDFNDDGVGDWATINNKQNIYDTIGLGGNADNNFSYTTYDARIENRITTNGIQPVAIFTIKEKDYIFNEQTRKLIPYTQTPIQREIDVKQ